jgi:hypothetical protein
MRLYHHTNNPNAVLVENPDHDDLELVLTASSSHLPDYDVLLRIDIPDSEMSQLSAEGKSTWTTTAAVLRATGAEIDCATEDDRERVVVYDLAAERVTKLQTIRQLNRYIAAEEDRPEASRFAIMLRAHQDELTDLENAIADGCRRFGVRHLEDVHADVSY